MGKSVFKPVILMPNSVLNCSRRIHRDFSNVQNERNKKHRNELNPNGLSHLCLSYGRFATDDSFWTSDSYCYMT